MTLCAKVLHMTKLDDYDRKIIEALQANGRLSNMDIAGQVNLSHSSCSRRIARLEKEGVIVGYRALTDRQKLGLSVRAYCGVIRDAAVGWEDVPRVIWRKSRESSAYLPFPATSTWCWKSSPGICSTIPRSCYRMYSIPRAFPPPAVRLYWPEIKSIY